MLSLGTLRRDAPLRWAAVVAIRLFLVVCLVEFLVTLLSVIPYWMSARRTTAQAEAAELRKAVGMYLQMTGRIPASLDDLKVPQPKNDGDPIYDINCDPWGHPFGFTVGGPRSVTITCLGADGAVGGEGDDADILVHWPSSDEGAPR